MAHIVQFCSHRNLLWMQWVQSATMLPTTTLLLYAQPSCAQCAGLPLRCRSLSPFHSSLLTQMWIADPFAGEKRGGTPRPPGLTVNCVAFRENQPSCSVPLHVKDHLDHRASQKSPLDQLASPGRSAADKCLSPLLTSKMLPLAADWVFVCA